MRRSIRFCLATLTLLVFVVCSGCSDSSDPATETRYESQYITVQIADTPVDEKHLSAEDTDFILSVLNNSEWKFDVTKTLCDYVLVCGDSSVSYSSEAGLFNDTEGKRHLVITKEQRDRINSIIE